MKFTIALVVLCTVVAVYGEECRSVDGCTHVTCPEQGYMLECHNRQCTCTHATASCTSQADCQSADSNCRSDWHCVDNACRCGFGFGGFLGGK